MAQKLFDEGKNLKDSDARYAMLQQARTIGMNSGAVKAAVNATRVLSAIYEVDGLELAGDLILGVQVSPTDTRRSAVLVAAGFYVMEAAVMQDRYDLAEEVARRTLEAAEATRSADIRESVQQYAQELRDGKQTYEKVQEAQNRRSEGNSDAETNLLLGRYFCFVKRDWNQGAPLLAKGSNTELRDLCQRQLQSTPDVATQLAIANSWYALADNASVLLPTLVAHQQKSIKLHARQLYQNLLPFAEGPIREQVEARLADIGAALGE